MNSMVPWRIENPLQRSYAINYFSVDPKLVNQIELFMNEEQWGWDEEGHW